MPQHISRKELKKDNIREGIVHGAEAVAHQKNLWVYGAAVLIVAAAVAGWHFYTLSQTEKASVALADAMQVYQARIRAVNEPQVSPDELTYVNEKNRDTDAEKKFSAVAAKYGHTYPGELARYYDALCLEVIGRDADAEKALISLSSSRDAGLKALAEFQRAQIDDRAGKSADAVKLYEDLEAKPSLFVPKALVMLNLADHYSASDPAKAAQLYTQIKTEFPDTAAATTADQHLQMLSSKS